METRTQPLARDAMAYVLAGGRGSRLKELTDRRAKPAVYFGGKTGSSTSRCRTRSTPALDAWPVGTQYKAHSLIRHLQRGWNFLRPERNESFDILPASQRVSETQWYEGTADAVFQNIDIIDSYGPEYMIILAGDHIYKMDYELMLRQHCDTDAGRDGGLPGGAAHGRHGLRRHARGRGGRHHGLHGEACRPALHPRPTGRGAGLDGHLRLQDQVPDGPAAPRRRRPKLQPRLRLGPDPLHRGERQGGGASLLELLRAHQRRGGGLLA
jgi:hypothetical protein